MRDLPTTSKKIDVKSFATENSCPNVPYFSDVVQRITLRLDYDVLLPLTVYGRTSLTVLTVAFFFLS